MIGLSLINKVNLPLQCVMEVYKHLRYMGREHLEGVALLVGRSNDAVFDIMATIIPAQNSYQLESGLLYSVPGEELFRINKLLYENQLTLIAQVHSHPGAAYHSDTDDAYPIVTVQGGLSIVVPNFGYDAFDLDDWAVYRLSDRNEWKVLGEDEVRELIKVS